MENDTHVELTQLLRRFSEGQDDAKEKVLLLLYDELRGLASGKMRRQNPGHTLQPTVLVHELWAKFSTRDQVPIWPSRGHFFKWASTAMGNYLRDYARHKKTQKAGGDLVRISLEGYEFTANDSSASGVLDIMDAIEALSKIDPERAEIVRLRAFGGLSYAEIAAALDTTEFKVDHSLQASRAWLANRLESQPTDRGKSQ